MANGTAPSPCIEAGGYPWPYGACLDAGDLNAAFEGSAGPAAPARLAGFKRWVDTSVPGYAAQRYNDGTQPVLTGQLDTINHLWLPLVGGGVASLAGSGAIDLGLIPETLITLSADQVTSFGASLQPGSAKIVLFAGATELINSSVLTLIGSGAANYLTMPGDAALVLAAGGGNSLVLLFLLTPAAAPAMDRSLSLDTGGVGTIPPGITRVYLKAQADITLTLPPNDCLILDRSGTGSTAWSITLAPPAGATINGQGGFVLPGGIWASQRFYFDGTSYGVDNGGSAWDTQGH